MNDKTNYCEIFKALSHPHRLEIVKGLYKNECSVSECQKRMNLPQSTVSQHLRVLKNAGIIIDKRKGNTVCYKVINEFVTFIIEHIEK